MMQIGVIGSGLIGGNVARLASAAGHAVLVANSRAPETLAEFADKIGARAVWAREAAAAADIVILSIPQHAVVSITPELFAATPAGAAVVDTGNYYPRTRDGLIAGIEGGLLDSEWVATRVGRPVVKAFNMIKANSLASGGTPRGTPNRIAIALAGDDAAQRERVSTLIDDIGFDPVDAGPLSESWRFQTGTICYCNNHDALTLRAAMAAVKRSYVAHYRREGDDFGTELVRLHGSIDAVGAAKY